MSDNMSEVKSLQLTLRLRNQTIEILQHELGAKQQEIDFLKQIINKILDIKINTYIEIKDVV